MKGLSILLAPVFWSIKNDIIRFKRSFYKKTFFYILTSCVFIFLITKLLSIGIAKLQNLSPDVFSVLFIKGYSLIFMLIFFTQVLNGFVISQGTYYQSGDLEVLFTSPVNRTSLFFSRLFETHVKASWMLVIFGIPLLVSSGLLYHANFFYYFYSFLLFIAFSTIPVNTGIGITIFLSSIFHIRRMKRFLFSTGIVAVVLLVIMFRIFRPERFVNPELFANLTLFISEIETPFFILLPNRWLSESIFDFLSKTLSSSTLIFVSLLFLTSYITTLFLLMIFKKYHYRGWGLLQEGGIILRERPHAAQITTGVKEIRIPEFLDPLTRMLDTQSRMLIKKDLLYQIRDVKNIHQILIILSLIIVYLFSIASLPLNWEDYAVQLKYIVSFFNLGLILIIIASLCLRFVYPATLSEGSSLWIIKTSPMKPKRFIRAKFLFFFIPIFLVGQVFTVSSSLFIGIERTFILLKVVTTTLLSFSLVSMAIAFGISDLRHALADTSQEQTRTGSTAYMLISVLLILFTLTSEIVPVFLYFLREVKEGAFTQMAWIAIGVGIFVLLLVNSFITFFSVRLGIKNIDKIQF